MIPVEPTPLRASCGLRLLGIVLVAGVVPCLPAGAAPAVLPPGAVGTPPPGAVVVPGPVRLRARRQAVDSEAGTTPTVTVRVIAPASVAPGKEFTYRIVAANISDAPAHHVYVKATLSRSAKVGRSTPPAEVTSPAGAPAEKATVVSWKLDTLAARDKREQSFVVTPAGDDEVICSARVQFEHGQRVRTRVEKPDLAPVAPLPPAPPADPAPAAPSPAVVARPGTEKVEKERQPPARAALRLKQVPPPVTTLPPEETFTYKYEVTNVGTAPAKDVVLEATPAKELNFLTSKPSTDGKIPVKWEFAEIAPGATERVEYHIAGEKVGTYRNVAVVRAAGGLREEVDHTVRIGRPKFEVTVVGPSQRGVLRDATYRITVKNVGDVPAMDVRLSDSPIKHFEKKDKEAGKRADEIKKISDDVTRSSASDGGVIEGNVARWSLRTLAPGASQTVSIVLRAKRTGELDYTCHVRGRDGLLEQGKAFTAFVVPSPLELDFHRIGPSAKVKVGDEVAYTLRLRNGEATTNTQIDVRVSVPEGLELVDPPPPPSRAKGAPIRLVTVKRLDPGSGVATLRFRATRPGIVRLSLAAVSTQTGPDNPATIDEVVTVAE